MIVLGGRRSGPARPRRQRRLARHRRRPDRGGRAAARVRPGRRARSSTRRQCYVVPGFIDVHVHGVDGIDTLDDGDARRRDRRALPRYGVTAFCPTTVACDPGALRGVPRSRSRRRALAPAAGAARVLPAHLESNFINPEYRGAQPLECLRCRPIRRPHRADDGRGGPASPAARSSTSIAAGRADVGIVTRGARARRRTRPGARAVRGRAPRVARPLGRRLRGRRSPPSRRAPGTPRTSSTG